MFRTIKSVVFSLLVLMAFNSCEKEMSQENGGLTTSGTQSGTAIYTLDGAPNGCITPLINGDYIVGTPMDLTNSVIVTVNVASVGTYVISTALINGIKFTGSGTFPAAGPQSITLLATGTPTSAMTATYIPGTSGCSFLITAITGTVTPVAEGTLDCSTATLAGVYTQSISLNGTNTVTIPVNVTTAGSYSITSTVTNGVTFSGSGNLALGAQNIVLTGNGVPVNQGAVSIPVSLGASNCTIPITFLPAPPPAAGTLNCATAVITGVYIQGISLDAGSTVTIPVNVTSAGMYSITTTANGCTFSGSGLLSLGAQNIVLTGSGNPANTGPFSFPVTLGASNCSFSITFTASSTDYFRVKIDGMLKTFEVNLDGDITPLSLPNTVAIVGDNSASSTEHLDVTVQSINPITTGTYFQPLGATFCTSRYFDPVSGQGWQASTPSAPPLTVIVTAISATRITGTFSGQYFDFNGTGTNTKQLTEGAFSVPLP